MNQVLQFSLIKENSFMDSNISGSDFTVRNVKTEKSQEETEPEEEMTQKIFCKDMGDKTCHMIVKVTMNDCIHQRKQSRSKCQQCRTQNKQELKRQKLDNLKKQYQQYEKEQNDIYLQAVRAMKTKTTEDKIKIIKAFKETEVEVDKAASMHAFKYCRRQSITSQDIINSISFIYKILLLPEGPLEQYAKSQQKNVLKQEYKIYAKQIHPDKNQHPQAIQAFQKMKKYWIDIPKMINNNYN